MDCPCQPLDLPCPIKLQSHFYTFSSPITSPIILTNIPHYISHFYSLDISPIFHIPFYSLNISVILQSFPYPFLSLSTMESLVDLTRKVIWPMISHYLNPTFLQSRFLLHYTHFKAAFLSSNLTEQILLLAFTVLMLYIFCKFVYHLAKATVHFFLDIAKYLLLLVTVLFVVEYREKIEEIAQPYVRRFLH